MTIRIVKGEAPCTLYCHPFFLLTLVNSKRCKPILLHTAREEILLNLLIMLAQTVPVPRGEFARVAAISVAFDF